MDLNLKPVAQRALELIEPGSVVGLGTGRAATGFLEALAEKARSGFPVSGVPTSQATAERAQQLGILLVSPMEIDEVDITVDGADEVDPRLNLIKGLGGALVREKIVAAASKKFVILVDARKCVRAIGEHGVLPVEVIPFGLRLGQRKLAAMGFASDLRMSGAEAFRTDNGNAVLDCRIPVLSGDLEDLDRRICQIPGVVATGLFLGMASVVLVQKTTEVRMYTRETGGDW